MDFNQLSAHLTTLGVVLTPDAIRRAALYVDYLDAAELFFGTTLNAPAPGGIGVAAYAFCAPALTSSNLLQELAEILDYYVSPALDVAMQLAFQAPPGNGYTYAQYFDNDILDANALTFAANILAFRTAIPVSASAIQILSQNFMANIKLACERIYADRALLTTFYADLYQDNFSILSLARIKSTGSDFHKGGKQVLILTFTITHLVDYGVEGGYAYKQEQLKTIYKPSDLEADCLIIGDSAVVNRTLNPTVFMANSLCEIYNARLQLIVNADPTFTGLPLRTYRLLPRNYLSPGGVLNPLPLRNAYGYIEYLDNDVSGTAASFFGYYPFASSDYLLFSGDDQPRIIRDFYRREGAFSALASTFSLEDLHIENMRVMQRDPYPIDLEICLTSAVDDVEATSLFGQFGGVTAVSVNVQESYWTVTQAATPGQASMNRVYPTVYCQNRLWRVAGNGQQQVVPVDRVNYLRGFNDGMAVLRQAQQGNDFNAWFTRLTNVVVRCLPYATGDFKRVASNAFINGLERHPAWTINQAVDDALLAFMTIEYDGYVQQGVNTANPNFVTLTPTEAGADYLNLDIPVFYHQIGTLDIVNSRGATVPIPNQVTTFGLGNPPVPPTQLVPVQGVGGAVLNRATFYAAAPTANVVRANQVTVLGGGGYAARSNLLRTSITTYFGANADGAAQRVVPVV